MANNSTGQGSFGFLSSAGFSMEERSGAMEGAPLFGFDSKEIGDSVTEKGSHVVVATPLNVAAPGGMRWSPGTFADGIISVAGKEGKGEVLASQGGAAGGSGGSNDTLIGLELGKRTYFEVPGGGGGGGGQAPSQAPPKKLRIAGQTPKCQVEGCKTDLTSAKDYHRRHKVCAIHSKAARVIVAGQEQRFCQQCSRFHGLTEFDEGKRSCRRRLAGHNERRRKPQPDTLAFNARFLPAFQDSRRLGHLYTDRSSFLPHVRIPGVSALWDECDDLNPSQQKGAWPPRMLKYEDQSSFECSLPAGAGMERQLFLTGLQHPNDRPSLFPPQSPKGMIPVSNDVVGPKTHQYFQGSVDPLGQSLSLTSSSGAGVLSGLEAIPVGQGFTRVSDSGRALSLQSTMQLLSSTQASVAVSLDMTTNHSNIMSDQGLHSSKIPIAQPLVQGGQQHHFEWGNDKLLSAASSLHTMSSATTGYPAGSNTIEKGFLEGPYTHGLNGIGSYECLPLYSMLQGEVRLGDLQQDVKPTIDLMQVASASHGQSTQPLVSSGFDVGISHFGDLQALRPYDSSIFSSQQM